MKWLAKEFFIFPDGTAPFFAQTLRLGGETRDLGQTKSYFGQMTGPKVNCYLQPYDGPLEK